MRTSITRFFTRAEGLKLIMVTGRVVSELLHVFPDAEQWFDTIVAENGGVIRYGGISHAVTAPVPLALDAPLVERGVHFERGQVLLACHSDDELAVLKEVRNLGADCQLIRNRNNDLETVPGLRLRLSKAFLF